MVKPPGEGMVPPEYMEDTWASGEGVKIVKLVEIVIFGPPVFDISALSFLRSDQDPSGCSDNARFY